MASSVGIELRRPYHDFKLIQFAFTIPGWYLLRGYTEKYLHRKAMAHLLPQAVLTRTTKATFDITHRWLMSEIRQTLMSEVSDSGLDWVEHSEAAKLLEAVGTCKKAWPFWMLWGLFGCGAISSGRATGKNGRLV